MHHVIPANRQSPYIYLHLQCAHSAGRNGAALNVNFLHVLHVEDVQRKA